MAAESPASASETPIAAKANQPAPSTTSGRATVLHDTSNTARLPIVEGGRMQIQRRALRARVSPCESLRAGNVRALYQFPLIRCRHVRTATPQALVVHGLPDKSSGTGGRPARFPRLATRVKSRACCRSLRGNTYPFVIASEFCGGKGPAELENPLPFLYKKPVIPKHDRDFH